MADDENSQQPSKAEWFNQLAADLKAGQYLRDYIDAQNVLHEPTAEERRTLWMHDLTPDAEKRAVAEAINRLRRRTED